MTTPLSAYANDIHRTLYWNLQANAARQWHLAAVVMRAWSEIELSADTGTVGIRLYI